MVKPAGRALAPGGVGFCENTFCEPIEDTKAIEKQTTIAARKLRTFLLYPSPVSWCVVIGDGRGCRDKRATPRTHVPNALALVGVAKTRTTAALHPI